MSKRILLLINLLLLSGSIVFAQNTTVRGVLIDAKDNQPVLNVTVQLASTMDTSNKQAALTDPDGIFTLTVPAGSYTLTTTTLGYESIIRTLTLSGAPVDLGTIALKGTAAQLQNVTVQSTVLRTDQNGDTTAFNANAYKVNPDANAEDLIIKMPGVTNDNGTIKVNGEDVKRVLVDGKDFFGDDPNAAIKNLPAEIIDKIQVYDRASDQAAFAGFDDGNQQKTINIVTRRGRNNGMFGKVQAGYGIGEEGDNGRYTLGGNINFFNGDRRISLVGLANNINQQNFSSEDLLGVSSGSGGGGRSGGGRRGGSGGSGFTGGAGSYGGDAASNFLVSQQGGITETQSIGINYSDTWGKKLKATGSYFFNRSDNSNTAELTRTYITDTNLVYTERGFTRSVNNNHRASLRIEWTIDSANSIILNPRLSYQQNETNRNLGGATTLGESIRQDTINNLYNAVNNGYNFSNSALWRHRFAKQGRTLSVNLDTRLNSKTGNGSLYSSGDTVLNQRNDLDAAGTTLSMGINYTEPISDKSQLQVNYSPSYNHNTSDRSTYNYDGAGYTDLDTGLTNRFTNNYTYHRGGVGYRYNDSLFSFNATLNAQYATLDGTQTYPLQLDVNRNFTNLLPQAMFNYRFSRKENIRVFYRTNNNAPSITQLQNIVDNSNPLFLRTGNPDLVQDYIHSLGIRYGKTGIGKGDGLFVFANGSYVKDYIGNATYIASGDSMTVRNVRLNPGTQLSLPVNLDAAWRGSAFLTYSLPVTRIKSNINLSGGFTYNRTPAIINNLENFATNYAFNGGLVVGSNISENLDFTVTYNGACTIAKNSLQSQSNFSYYTQTTSLKLNWIFLKGVVFNTNLTHTLYSGLGDSYDRQFLLWNASLGYKFLKSKALQADIYAFDILKQNNSINRTITDTYIEDSRTQVLQRYFMLRLTYTLRAFKGGATMPESDGMREGGREGEGRRMRGNQPEAGM
jgi:uncharacterized membrane protein YgcG